MIEIGTEKRLSADLRAIVYRSVRELINNVIQHGQANRVSVTVERTDLQICISVEDDGIGFESEDISSGLTRSGGFGLFSIQERMNDLGGSLTIQSAAGEGTRIMLCVPQEDS